MQCAAFVESIRAYGSLASEIPAQFLLAFDRFEQRLEVAGAKALRTLALNYLVENGRAIFDWLGEDLKQISFIITIDQNPKLLERCNVFVDFSNAVGNAVVIGRRNTKEFDASRFQIPNGPDD